jgi:hypothetical protein
MLVHLGPATTERPASFLAGKLETTFVGAKDNVEAPLIAARAFQWPPLFDVEPILQRVNAANPAMNAETPEDDRYNALMTAAAGDEGLRAALKAQVANLLEDSGHALWLRGVDDRAGEAARPRDRAAHQPHARGPAVARPPARVPDREHAGVHPAPAAGPGPGLSPISRSSADAAESLQRHRRGSPRSQRSISRSSWNSGVTKYPAARELSITSAVASGSDVTTCAPV